MQEQHKKKYKKNRRKKTIERKAEIDELENKKNSLNYILEKTSAIKSGLMVCVTLFSK